MSKKDTPAGEHPTADEMKAHGLTEEDIPIWWAFLEEAYPHKHRITGGYDRAWWIWFHAGWLRRGEKL